MTENKGLFLKLHAIQEAIGAFSKDGDTKTDNNPKGYKYVTGDQVLKAIKPLMNQQKVILKQEIISIENTRQDYKTKYSDKSEILSKVMMKFTWVDCETGQTDENMFGANGQNDWEKGLGSALTYGERYFLLKYFHIPTDEDDIDNPNRKKADQPQQQNQKQNQAKKVLTFEQASTLLNGCDKLDVLAQTYKTFTPEMQKLTLALKDQLKEKLTPKTT